MTYLFPIILLATIQQLLNKKEDIFGINILFYFQVYVAMDFI
jgi:hypothetical protein